MSLRNAARECHATTAISKAAARPHSEQASLTAVGGLLRPEVAHGRGPDLPEHIVGESRLAVVVLHPAGVGLAVGREEAAHVGRGVRAVLELREGVAGPRPRVAVAVRQLGDRTTLIEGDRDPSALEDLARLARLEAVTCPQHPAGTGKRVLLSRCGASQRHLPGMEG